MELLNTTQFALTELSITIILINLVIAFFASSVIALVYQRTHRGISYSNSFVESLILIGILSAVIIMILENNLIRALGILGIFTLVRFRSIIKDTKDAAYLIFTIVIGLAVGTANYPLGLASLAFLSGVIFLLTKYNFGSRIKEGFLLTLITQPGNDLGNLRNFFENYLNGYKILQIKTNKEEQVYFLSIRLKNKGQTSEFVTKLGSQDGVKMADLASGQEAAEF